ncbi:hypothetical protein [Xenorhabdus bovienii]|uniref:Uncharacterized protein n=2 Tax=Xenorhabdus bovienii TaxID=40576 RepID=A0A0B6XBY3_XENBV|nr:hypothetical protein [Xenorhabdus bovienii]CDH05468.1 conserved hypothetical protein [Xenorhabdus bovienii str. oregonense]CDM91115.1 conserved protein of unknown function [Xenorhabdus bovienii]
MNVIWRAVCFCYDNAELPFTDTQDEWFVFVDAPDRKTALAKFQALLPVVWGISPDIVEHFSPRSEEELRALSLMPGTPDNVALLECGWEQGKPQYLTANEVLFWVASPQLQQRLIAALNYVSREAADGFSA